MASNTHLEFPFRYTNVEKIGPLFYPIVNIGLFTLLGWKEFGFIVDTGADVTVIPKSLTRILKVNESKLKKIDIIGVGGSIVPVWEYFMPIRIGDTELEIRVDFADGSNVFLLGKKDIFESKFSLIIDSGRKVTGLRKN